MEVWVRGVTNENREKKTSIHMIDWYDNGEYIDLPSTREEALEAIEQLRNRDPGLYGALTGEVVEVDGSWYAVVDGIFASSSLAAATRYGGDCIQIITGKIAATAYDGDIIRNPEIVAEFPMTPEGIRQAEALYKQLANE